jgi:hypothetical protein
LEWKMKIIVVMDVEQDEKKMMDRTRLVSMLANEIKGADELYVAIKISGIPDPMVTPHSAKMVDGDLLLPVLTRLMGANNLMVKE